MRGHACFPGTDCDLSTWGAETGGDRVWGQPGWLSEPVWITETLCQKQSQISKINLENPLYFLGSPEGRLKPTAQSALGRKGPKENEKSLPWEVRQRNMRMLWLGFDHRNIHLHITLKNPAKMGRAGVLCSSAPSQTLAHYGKVFFGPPYFRNRTTPLLCSLQLLPLCSTYCHLVYIILCFLFFFLFSFLKI